MSPATENLQQAVLADLNRTRDRTTAALNGFLKRRGLSEPQFNVLRILRGAGPRGLTCGEIKERLTTRLPDITRIVDRLESAGHATRQREIAEDRRKVVIRITPAASRLLGRLEAPLEELRRELFAGMTQAELRQLRQLLEKVL